MSYTDYAVDCKRLKLIAFLQENEHAKGFKALGMLISSSRIGGFSSENFIHTLTCYRFVVWTPCVTAEELQKTKHQKDTYSSYSSGHHIIPHFSCRGYCRRNVATCNNKLIIRDFTLLSEYGPNR